jgi:hypothetical protein
MIKKIEKFNAETELYALNVEIVSHLALAQASSGENCKNPVNLDESASFPAAARQAHPLKNLPRMPFKRQYTISLLNASLF